MSNREGERGFSMCFRMANKDEERDRFPIDECGNITEDLFKPLDKKILAGLAKKLYRNEIFTSMQVHPHDGDMIPMIFMGVGFADTASRMFIKHGGYAHCYSYIEDCMPRSINGYPVFTSVYYLTQEEVDVVLEKHKQILDVMDALDEE